MSPTTLEFILFVLAIFTCRRIEANMMHQEGFTGHQGLLTRHALVQFPAQALLDDNVRWNVGVL
jgi:hypothetical protein